MIIEKVYNEVSNTLTEQQFEEAYKHATTEPHDCLVIYTHPETSIDKRLRFFLTILNSSIIRGYDT